MSKTNKRKWHSFSRKKKKTDTLSCFWFFWVVGMGTLAVARNGWGIRRTKPKFVLSPRWCMRCHSIIKDSIPHNLHAIVVKDSTYSWARCLKVLGASNRFSVFERLWNYSTRILLILYVLTGCCFSGWNSSFLRIDNLTLFTQSVTKLVYDSMIAPQVFYLHVCA